MMAMEMMSQIASLPRKPPVTLALIAINVLTWLGFGPFAMVSSAKMCPSDIVDGYRPWFHLLLAGFVHAQDGGYHLIYNMMSLLWKGVTLEFEMGSENFALMTAALLLIAHSLFVPVAYIATAFFGASTYYSCAVGFSAVLFGLKVVMNHSAVGHQAVSFWGIPFPVEAKYAAWVELVIISLISPNASFVGHLCGILAGVIWLYAAPLMTVASNHLRRITGAGLGERNYPHETRNVRNFGGGVLGSAQPATAWQAHGQHGDADLQEVLARSRYDF
jgi:rhomboid domain-containing protein 1